MNQLSSPLLSKCLLNIEECLNTFRRIWPDAVDAGGEDWQTRIESALDARRTRISASDYVLRLLPQRGFTYPDGQANGPEFYRYAHINPDVWNSFLNHTHAPSTATLMKIVIGLRMSEVEACEFLALAGSGFSAVDPVHRILLACIDCGYYNPELVYDIIEYYRPIYENKKGVRYHNIYEERKWRQTK